MLDVLKKQDSFVELKKNIRIGGVQTSGIIIDISKTQFMEDLVNAIDWQLKEIGIEPSTQKSVPKEHSEEKKEDTQEDLPF